VTDTVNCRSIVLQVQMVAISTNALSTDHRKCLAADGLGILAGDGQLNYRPESILETFYAMNVINGIIPDARLSIHDEPDATCRPRADLVFSGRLHGEF
jgi:high affinity Mn2+ porin